MKRYLSAREAAEYLGVSAATVYSYVSRGLIRSESAGDDSRARRYLAEDVVKLKERKDYRRDPAKVAQDALHWGTPILDSALTLITDNKLYYRGRDVLELAQIALFEQVAALLWMSDTGYAYDLFSIRPDTVPLLSQIAPKLTVMQRLMVALTLADDLPAFDLRPESVARSGARILNLMAAALTMQIVEQSSLAAHLQEAWRPEEEDGQAAQLINAALILCADHELNVSAFAARVVASAGSNPYAVVMAGLAALQGYKHGGNTERVERFFREIESLDRIDSVTSDWLRRGERIPGFGHSLYSGRDPRATQLLMMLREAYPNSDEVALAFAVVRRAAAIIERQPNIDFALTALARTLHLPDGSPLALFALGRTAGWIGHAIEQYSTDALIRPRARYTGEAPLKDSGS